MRRVSLGIDVWTWINAMLVFSCVVLIVYLREDHDLAMWVAGCAACGALLTALGRLAARPFVPMTLATLLLLLPWAAGLALLIFLSWAFSHLPD